jgi:hypothetical protein
MMFRTALVAAALAWAGAAQAQVQQSVQPKSVPLRFSPLGQYAVERLEWEWPTPEEYQRAVKKYKELNELSGIPPQGNLRTFPGTAIIIPDDPSAKPPPKTVIWQDNGGQLKDYDARWVAIGRQGGEVEVRGLCRSGCTLVTGIPKHRLCFAAQGALDFHQARLTSDGSAAMEITRWMFSVYPDDIRKWINARGGLEKMPYEGFWRLSASELWQMGYPGCGD